MPVSGVIKGETVPLANYDYQDLAAGTGIVSYYAAKGGSAGTGILTTTKVYSRPYLSSAAANVLAYTKLIDLDFDMIVNKHITIRGSTIINVPISYTGDLGNGYTTYCYVKARIRKWDGVTETEIASGDSDEVSNGGSILYAMLGPIVTTISTRIKSGEYLRITIEVWGKSSSASLGYQAVGVAYDSMNRTTGWDASGVCPSNLIIPIPMRIYE